MKNFDAEDLLKRYSTGNVSEEERALVETWYLQYKPGNFPADVSEQELEDSKKGNLKTLLDTIKKKQVSLWPKISVAATLVIAVSLGLIIYISKDKAKTNNTAVNAVKADVLPGGDKAILTLSDGKKLILTDSRNGIIAHESGVLVNKSGDGKISYVKEANTDKSTANQINMAETPRGGQYHLTLSDGTGVWLNAASSIKFPVVFNGNERKVEITGEVYFEVTHINNKPFRVISKEQTIDVLGTHFDVNTYEDDGAIKTTLLQGSIALTAGNLKTVVKPGQQAILKNSSLKLANVDTDDVMAWHRGYFNFKDADLHLVMNQLARWYDVDVQYQGNIPKREFSGQISRNVNASQILDILSFKKIHYQINDKIITITP